MLTGGNGRGNPAATNTYAFHVPAGLHDLDASATFADLNDGVVAYLIDPQGEAVASSSNVTFDSTGTNAIGTNAVNVYKDNPQPGEWQLVFNWLQPGIGLRDLRTVRRTDQVQPGQAELDTCRTAHG